MINFISFITPSIVVSSGQRVSTLLKRTTHNGAVRHLLPSASLGGHLGQVTVLPFPPCLGYGYRARNYIFNSYTVSLSRIDVFHKWRRWHRNEARMLFSRSILVSNYQNDMFLFYLC